MSGQFRVSAINWPETEEERFTIHDSMTSLHHLTLRHVVHICSAISFLMNVILRTYNVL